MRGGWGIINYVDGLAAALARKYRLIGGRDERARFCQPSTFFCHTLTSLLLLLRYELVPQPMQDALQGEHEHRRAYKCQDRFHKIHLLDFFS